MNPNLFKPLLLLLGSLALASSVLAQQPAVVEAPVQPAGINVTELVTGALSRALNPPDPTLESEVLPKPPEHYIPLKATADPSQVLVESDDNLVRIVVRDAPLRQVLALLAESQKLNLVFSTTAEVRVTVSLDRVPLTTALDAILASCGHTWTQQGNIIHISEVSATRILAPSVQGRQLRVFPLEYLTAVDVNSAVEGLLSPIGKSWAQTSSSDNNLRTREVLVVEDLPEYVDRITGYIAQIDIPPRQMLVEVQILEIKLDNDLKHGVNFKELGNSGIRFESTGFAKATSPQAFFIELKGGDLTALVELLEETNDTKTLASPKLLAVNGQESTIDIVKKLPYRETTNSPSNVSQETVKFLDVGVKLKFTPWITRDGRVLIHVVPEVSDGALNSRGDPETTATRVATDVFLNDGQGIVIGGLIRERDSIEQSKIPWLGDIRYAGALFQKRNVIRERSEIIVALMPHLLPYNPGMQCANDQEVMRAREPLLVGPLCRNPRPYEPRLPDAVEESRQDYRERHGLPPESCPGCPGKVCNCSEGGCQQGACLDDSSVEPGSPLQAGHKTQVAIRRLPPVVEQPRLR